MGHGTSGRNASLHGARNVGVIRPLQRQSRHVVPRYPPLRHAHWLPSLQRTGSYKTDRTYNRRQNRPSSPPLSQPFATGSPVIGWAFLTRSKKAPLSTRRPKPPLRHTKILHTPVHFLPLKRGQPPPPQPAQIPCRSQIVSFLSRVSGTQKDDRR